MTDHAEDCVVPTIKTPGQIAFEGYWEAYGTGIPPWESCSTRVKELWESAADAVMMRVDI